MTRPVLLLVDLQNDFCSGGALPVPNGEEVMAVANRLTPAFRLVVATQDWHPADHGSFAASHRGHAVYDQIELAGQTQTLWPVHCVQNTPGAELHPVLERTKITRVFPKGTDPAVDSYSGFFDNARLRATGLEAYLRAAGTTDLHVMGLATDYCVKFTVLDGLDEGFRVFVVTDGCRGVELSEGDGDRALQEMAAAGATLLTSDEVLERLA